MTDATPQTSPANGSNGQGAVFLSTLPAGPGERRLALGVALASAAFFLLVAPFARIQLGQVWAFIPMYESAAAMCDLITAALLLGQFGLLRSRALLVLGCAYLYTALMTVPHLLTFPGLFAPAGLLGAGLQSTAWLYIFWHSGFPLLVAAYALLGKPGQAAPIAGRSAPALLGGLAVVAAAVGAGVLLATAGHGVLPLLMQGQGYTPQAVFVFSGMWAVGLLALVLLWRRRPFAVLDLWLTVVVLAWLLEVALSAVINGGRFSLGFYAGRAYGLLAAGFLLIVLLVEHGRLYARLLWAYEAERRERRLVQEKSTELKQLNRDLDAFSYSVSHDLRAPLRAVDGFARILEEDYGDRLDAEGRRLLGVLRDGGRRMSILIDELLNFAHLGRVPLLTRPVRLDELVRQTIEDLRSETAGRAIEFTVGELGTAQVDTALLGHVLVNLIGNAIKYTRLCNPARIEVGCRRGPGPDDIPVYYVKDNGAGFDMRYSAKLFGVFQRLHDASQYEGTGVGLAIVQRVVNRHGGRIWAEARPGEGACFYFTLESDPAQDAVSEEDASAPESASEAAR